jgi:bromodomain and WD repeat domain containing protein 1/3
VDVPAVYHQFQDTYLTSTSEDKSRPGPSTSCGGAPTSRGEFQKVRLTFFRPQRLVPPIGDWRMQCRELLQTIWNQNDSEPFQLPVDLVEVPGETYRIFYFESDFD